MRRLSGWQRNLTRGHYLWYNVDSQMNRWTRRWLQHRARKPGDLNRKKTHKMRSRMSMKEVSNGRADSVDEGRTGDSREAV